jgi:hypothetical protein
MTIYGATVVARNDNYGYFLTERALFCLTSLATSFDEVIYVDWNTTPPKRALIEDIEEFIPEHLKHKIKWIRILPEQRNEWVHNDPDAPPVSDTIARNIGLRRLSTEYMVSTNIDIICPPRQYLDEFPKDKVFYTTGRRSISLFKVWEFGRPTDVASYIPHLERLKSSWGQEPPAAVCSGDKASLVSNCGDFQLAHRDVWYGIRGFEERLYKRAFADSNVQRKAQIFGYGAKVNWNCPIWHLGHEGGYGNKGGINDKNLAIFMNETTNPETWGHSDVDLEVHQL